MVALMITTLVAALRERKAQALAAQQFAPAAVEDGEMGGEVPQDGFGDDPENSQTLARTHFRPKLVLPPS